MNFKYVVFFKDLSSVIKKTSDFLNVSLNDDQIERLREHLSFQNMKNNSSCNNMELAQKIKKDLKRENDDNLNFIRKGDSGGWKKLLTQNVLGESKFVANG